MPFQGNVLKMDNRDGERYCKATYVREGFNFANSQILCASQKLNAAKIKFLYYIHIEYNTLAKLNPCESAKMKHSLNLIFAKIYCFTVHDYVMCSHAYHSDHIMIC